MAKKGDKTQQPQSEQKTTIPDAQQSEAATRKKARKLSKELIAGLVILTLLTAGAFGVWFYQKNVIYRLQKQLEELQEQLASKETEKEVVYKVDTDIKLPVIVYNPPGAFDEAEKNELKEHLIDPFFDYYNGKELNFIAMIISHRERDESNYSVQAIHKIGGDTSFRLFRDRYWFPNCMGGCEFSEEFKKKYPEIVKLTAPYQESKLSD